MAKYLDLTGLWKVWAKIKGNFLSLNGGTGTGTVSSYIFGDGNHGRAYTEAAGYKILNGTSSQLLDASGGTCAEMTTSEINTICV